MVNFFNNSSSTTNKIWLVLIALSLFIAIYFLYSGSTERTYILKMSAGSFKGKRHELATILKEEAAKKNILIELVETKGSEHALELVSSGTIDLALVQGGIQPMPNVNQVLVLHHEPMHCLVKPYVIEEGLISLKGKKINLSAKGSGTHLLTKNLLKFIGFGNNDFVETNFSYSDIEKLDPTLPEDSLPDAFFSVSSLPSKQMMRLVKQFNYKIMEIPFGDAFSLVHFGVVETHIPVYTYGVLPPIPSKPIPTIGTQLLLVANEQLANEPVKRLLEILHEPVFARKSKIRTLFQESGTREILEFPLHPGSEEYRNRYKPAITGDTIDTLENFRSFVFSLGIALFLLWRWYESKRGLGLEVYFTKLIVIEKRLIKLELENKLTNEILIRMNSEITQIKSDALEKVQNQEIKRTELLSSFLTDVADLRGNINALMAMIERNSYFTGKPREKAYS